MKKTFQLGVTIVAVGALVLGVLVATHFDSMSAQAQKIVRSNETTNSKTMAGGNATSSGNATGNMTKGNSTSVPTPVGPPGP
jgi:hypothetical protein